MLNVSREVDLLTGDRAVNVMEMTVFPAWAAVSSKSVYPSGAGSVHGRLTTLQWTAPTQGTWTTQIGLNGLFKKGGSKIGGEGVDLGRSRK